MNGYLKAIVATVGAAALALESAYPTWLWLRAVTAVATALGVYVVPNKQQGSGSGGVPPGGH